MNVQATAEQAGRELKEHPAFDALVRTGLVGYGLVYLILGWMALQLVLGDREGNVSKGGALHQLAGETWGVVVLWAACIGLAGLAVFEALQVWLGHRSHDGARKTLARIGSAGRAVLYAVVAVSAAKTALGGKSTENPDSYTRKLMSTDIGPWLVAGVGLAIIGYAIGCLVIAVTDRYRKHLDIDGQTGSTGTVIKVVARVGYVSKSVAFGVIGALFIWAAWTHEPKAAGGLDAALSRLLEAPAGPALLGIVAVGFGCYGVFNLFRARYRDE